MKKPALLAIALLLALGAMGAGLAYFSDTATVSTTFTAGLWRAGMRAFVACTPNPHVEVEPDWALWDAPGLGEHIVIISQAHPGSADADLLLLYLVRNEGYVPMKLDSIIIDHPDCDWLEVVSYGSDVPKEIRSEAISTLQSSKDIPDDIKQAMIDFIKRNRQQECILQPGDESQRDTWGLIYIWLHITEDAPEDAEGTVTVSPVFNIWRY